MGLFAPHNAIHWPRLRLRPLDRQASVVETRARGTRRASRAPKRMQPPTPCGGQGIPIWDKYKDTSYRVIELLSAALRGKRRDLRNHRPHQPVYQHKPSLTDVNADSATITIHVSLPTKRHQTYSRDHIMLDITTYWLSANNRFKNPPSHFSYEIHRSPGARIPHAKHRDLEKRHQRLISQAETPSITLPNPHTPNHDQL